MSNDSKLITIYIPKNKADYLVIGSLLDSVWIEYFSLNAGVQNLFGGREIGGYNIAAIAIEIKVAEENVEKANELINSESQLTNLPELWCVQQTPNILQYTPNLINIIHIHILLYSSFGGQLFSNYFHHSLILTFAWEASCHLKPLLPGSFGYLVSAVYP